MLERRRELVRSRRCDGGQGRGGRRPHRDDGQIYPVHSGRLQVHPLQNRGGDFGGDGGHVGSDLSEKQIG